MNFDLSLYFLVLRKLEELKIPYVVIGAFAGQLYGIQRATHDVDILVDMNESQVDRLAAAFPSPPYYADPNQMLGAIRAHSNFNIIDGSRADKVDLFTLSMDRRYQTAFDKRTRQLIVEPDGQSFQIYVARVEDVIVGKLMAWAEGRSYRHVADIYEMMVFQYMQGDSNEREFDHSYVDERAATLGEDVLLQWQFLRDTAREYAEQNREPE